MTDTFKFLSLKKTKEGYEYCERKGKDSVAFILYDRKNKTVILRNEYKPPLETWLAGAFGGSLDKNKSLINTVIDEVREEAGFKVEEKNVHYCGKYFVSSQMNQFCFLYLIDVSDAMEVPKQPEDNSEAISDSIKLLYTGNVASQCWKTMLLYPYLKGII